MLDSIYHMASLLTGKRNATFRLRLVLCLLTIITYLC